MLDDQIISKVSFPFSQVITYKFFAKHIKTFETNNDVAGLWDSLNFVKKKEVKCYIEKQGSLPLEYNDDLKMIDDMVERATFDQEFKQRQKSLSRIAIFLKKIGVFNLVKLFPNLLPYMKIIFQKTG